MREDEIGGGEEYEGRKGARWGRGDRKRRFR
jgi:hypothetical protein